MICRKCGAQIAAEKKFCGVCGTAINKQFSSRPKVDYYDELIKKLKRRRKIKRILVVSLAVVILLGVVGIGFRLCGNNREGPDGSADSGGGDMQKSSERSTEPDDNSYVSTSAEGITEDYYTITEGDDSENLKDFDYIAGRDGIAIIKYKGIAENVIIPDIIEGTPVTEIGKNAFWGCSVMTSVTIPDSVTFIGAFAFAGCTSLTSVVIPDKVTYISEALFGDCELLTSVILPDGVTIIGQRAFSGCKSLTNITIPDSVISIGFKAFYECGSLSEETMARILQIDIGGLAF